MSTLQDLIEEKNKYYKVDMRIKTVASDDCAIFNNVGCLVTKFEIQGQAGAKEYSYKTGTAVLYYQISSKN